VCRALLPWGLACLLRGHPWWAAVRRGAPWGAAVQAWEWEISLCSDSNLPEQRGKRTPRCAALFGRGGLLCPQGHSVDFISWMAPRERPWAALPSRGVCAVTVCSAPAGAGRTVRPPHRGEARLPPIRLSRGECRWSAVWLWDPSGAAPRFGMAVGRGTAQGCACRCLPLGGAAHGDTHGDTGAVWMLPVVVQLLVPLPFGAAPRWL